MVFTPLHYMDDSDSDNDEETSAAAGGGGRAHTTECILHRSPDLRIPNYYVCKTTTHNISFEDEILSSAAVHDITPFAPPPPLAAAEEEETEEDPRAPVISAEIFDSLMNSANFIETISGKTKLPKKRQIKDTKKRKSTKAPNRNRRTRRIHIN